MPWLDGDQPAESMAEHEDRPDAQHTAGGEERDANPANGISVQGPELLAVGVGGEVRAQEPNDTEGCEHPAVAAILALAGAEISAAEQRDADQHEVHDGQRDQGRVGEKGFEAARAEDGEPEIGKGYHHGEQCHFRRERHGRLACTICLLIERREPPLATPQAMRPARRGAATTDISPGPTGHAGWWCSLTPKPPAGGRSALARFNKTPAARTRNAV